MKKLCVFLICACLHVHAAPFINLDFEMADVSSTTFETKIFPEPFCRGSGLFGTGKATDFLPGWTISNGSNQIALASFGFGFAETNMAKSRHAGIIGFGDNRFPDVCSPGPVAFQGKCALVMDNTPRYTNTALASGPIVVEQRGDIPIGVDTLTFSETYSSEDMPVAIEIDGIELFPNAICCDFLRQQVDISEWAGQTVTLRFLGGFITVIDDIRFERLNPQAQILEWSMSTNQFSCSWRASTHQFQPEVATNLPPVWQPLDVRIITNGDISQFTESFSVTNEPTSQRFYRLRTLR